MNKDEPQHFIWQKRFMKKLFPPSVILLLYGILFVLMPDKAVMALKSSGEVVINIIAPLCLVFIFILVLNLFLKPVHIASFLGREAGLKGILLSVTAGIISTGPVYAWYPLLKELRKKGVNGSLIAIFLGNRAVKPFLLPIMISYFGWEYALVLTVFTVLGSIFVGYTVGSLGEKTALHS